MRQTCHRRAFYREALQINQNFMPSHGFIEHDLQNSIK